MRCPVKNEAWHSIVAKYGENAAYKAFIANDMQTFTVEEAESLLQKSMTTIKPGVEELFDSNPNFANQVYEALGFNNNIEAINRIKKAEQDLKKIHEIGIADTIEEVEKAEGKKIIVLDTNDFNNTNQKSVSFDRIVIPEQFRKQGLGLSLYIIRGEELLKEGKYLVNYDQLSDEAVQIWRRLLDLGLATQSGQYGTWQYIGLQNQITPQQKQQALQLYSQYLDTIFPDSKVKDIVYHGTLDKIENFDKNRIGKNIIKDRPKGFYFTRKNVAENIYGSYPIVDASTGEQILQKGNLISAVIDTKGQYQLVQERDDISGYGDFVEYESHVVFEPEQIHILGSKQDINGFKEFAQGQASEAAILSQITYTNDEGKPCAKAGLTNAVKGTNWKIVKDFKGMPKHSQGGVDIEISNKGVSMKRGGSTIMAKYGLVIAADGLLLNNESSTEAATLNPNPTSTANFRPNAPSSINYDPTDPKKAKKPKEAPMKPYINDFRITDADLEYLNKNKEYCPKGECLEVSYKAYDKLVARHEGFPSSSQIKEKELGLHSLGKVGDKTAKQQYLEMNPDRRKFYDALGYMNPDIGDFTADSWDTHGKMVEKGGTNLFTDIEDAGLWKNLSEAEKKEIYAKMPVGTLIGFGGRSGQVGAKAYNEKYNLANNRHSAMMVGWTDDGEPVMYDFTRYARISDPTFNMNITNITYAKSLEGKNKEWAEKEGVYDTYPREMQLNWENLEKTAPKELKVFAKTLNDVKHQLMSDLNINNDIYDQMAKVLMAISLQETKGGEAIEHAFQKIAGTSFGETQGLTQLNIKNITEDPQLKEIAAKYGIRNERDLFDPKKAAIASMIYGKRNLIAAQKNFEKGKSPGERVFYPNPRSSVYNGTTFVTEEGVKVKVSEGSLSEVQKKLDAVEPGKYTIEVDTSKTSVSRTNANIGIRKITKKTAGNLQDKEVMDKWGQFLYNWQSPNALRTGDAQGDSQYLKKVKEYMKMFD